MLFLLSSCLVNVLQIICPFHFHYDLLPDKQPVFHEFKQGVTPTPEAGGLLWVGGPARTTT